jgi:hypothetical protein
MADDAFQAGGRGWTPTGDGRVHVALVLSVFGEAAAEERLDLDRRSDE